MADKKKWGIYRRRSTKGQEGNESFGIQERACLSYILREDPKAQKEKRIKYYDDDGISGAFLERAGILEMIADAENGELNEIVCQKIDRFTRAEDTGFLLEAKFKQLDVAITSAEGVNVKGEDDISGELMRGVDILFASHGKKRNVIDMRSGRRSKNANGFYGNGGSLSWGYYLPPKKDPRKSENRVILTNPEIKGIWNRIYNMIVIERFSLNCVCKKLKEDKITSPRVRKDGTVCYWTSPSLGKALENSSLYGEFYADKHKSKKVVKDGKQRVENRGFHDESMWHKIPISDPLLSKKQWDEIRNTLSSNMRKGAKVKDESFLLSELDILKCGICSGKIGCKRGVYSKAKGKDLTYYRCYWSTNGDDERKEWNREKCSLTGIDSDVVDKVIWYGTLGRMFGYSSILESFSDSATLIRKEKALVKEKAELESKLKPLNNRVKRLLDAYEGGAISLEEYKERKDERKQEIESIQKKIDTKKWELDKVENTLKKSEDLKSFHEYLSKMESNTLDKLEGLDWKNKKSFLKYIYGDLQFKLCPITKKEALKRVPDGDFLVHGIWFGQRSKTGVVLEWEGYFSPERVINYFESLNKNYSLGIKDTIC